MVQKRMFNTMLTLILRVSFSKECQHHHTWHLSLITVIIHLHSQGSIWISPALNPMLSFVTIFTRVSLLATPPSLRM